MINIFKISITFFCMTAAMICHSVERLESSKKLPTDVRVIIDVSGSMKKNDPENLRVPALKLLVGLLPDNVTAGVWNFGTKTKPLVKHGPVNKKWKKSANKAAAKIYSGDMFTDIERSLRTVISDWEEVGEQVNRNIILLTDGMVDVSKTQSKSDASRQRIIDEVLPELQSKGVTVYAISLSENADLELMDELSLGTDGASEQVNDADQLQRVFLHMFEKSTPRDTVPMENNQFTIDKMINEFTLLVFRNNDIKQTNVITPNGERFSRKTRPKNVAWLEEGGYDLITITKPEAGVWNIDADLDPDNRVMVVSKLKLHTSELPNSIFLGEEYDFKFWLTAGDKTIGKEAFYKLTEMKLLQTSGEEIQEVWELTDRNSKNEFNKKLGKTFKSGKLKVSVIVDGKTFKRQSNKVIEVYEQFYEVETDESKETVGNVSHVIKIKPNDKLVDRRNFQVLAKVTSPEGDTSETIGKMTMRGDSWLVKLEDPVPGEYTVSLDINTLTKSGRSVAVSSGLIRIGDPIIVEDLEDVSEEVAEDEEAEVTDWMQIGIFLLGVNVVLALVIGGIIMFLKKRKKAEVQPGEVL